MPVNVDAERQGGSETLPLLTPEPEPSNWQPLTKEELRLVAGGPGWKKVRTGFVILFGLGWLAMLCTGVFIIAGAYSCSSPPGPTGGAVLPPTTSLVQRFR
ncbi:hypothetical protein DPEC_G00314320 [Dallia pectoralis]|uniref:Uncharacterized protein n=1 Tax=Dallia pectoralis TaxID=75939 RepID=A0ACC2FCA8_DALPE|nr:hypothetical protein DPEC_G00314320 [Dallia pectoralis]